MRDELFIAGEVKGQGSLTLWRADDGSERAKHPPATVIWRNRVIGELTTWWGDRAPLRCAVRVDLVATFGRPKAHLGTGKNSGTLKQSAPTWHSSFPDGDKIMRLHNDALVIARVIADDSQVSWCGIRKCWAHPDERPGVLIRVEAL